jgi:hypothetical protein
MLIFECGDKEVEEMRMLRLFVLLAVMAGTLLWSNGAAEASNCCIQDCNDGYANIIAAGIAKSDADAWLADCKTNCREHGDPSVCIVQGVSLQRADKDDVSRALRRLLHEDTSAAMTSARNKSRE